MNLCDALIVSVTNRKLWLQHSYSKEYNMIRKSQANKVQSGLYHQTSHRLCFAHSPRLKIDTAYKHRLIYTLNNGFCESCTIKRI